MGGQQTRHLPLSVVVISTRRGGIGRDGRLSWNIPAQADHLIRVTTVPDEDGRGGRNAVIMGRRMWESLPEDSRPLPDRINVVLTRASSDPSFVSPYPKNVIIAHSVAHALEQLSTHDVKEVFAIGGEQVFAEAVDSPNCARIFLTRIGQDFACDASFPACEALDEERFKLVHVSKTHNHGAISFDFVVFHRADIADDLLSSATATVGSIGAFLHEEYQYLDLIRDVVENGLSETDQTVGTRSVFGRMMRFDLRHTFPLFTTKRVFWRGVVEELLWCVRGDTNANHLSDKGVKFGKQHGSREKGDVGPVHGFQWRHFGAKYTTMDADYTNQGVDQLGECIRRLKHGPTESILLSSWNPADLDDLALAPCHVSCQFSVIQGELSCLLHQRTGDVGLSIPNNIAFYSLLTCMMAQVCGLKPGDFIHALGETYACENHFEALKTQLNRTPRPFPVLQMRPVGNIEEFQVSDFELSGYDPHRVIPMQMAA